MDPRQGAVELGRFELEGRTFIVFQTINMKRPTVVHDTWEETEEDRALFQNKEFVDKYIKEVEAIWTTREAVTK